jgi:hypothetical protein
LVSLAIIYTPYGISFVKLTAASLESMITAGNRPVKVGTSIRILCGSLKDNMDWLPLLITEVVTNTVVEYSALMVWFQEAPGFDFNLETG